MIIVPGYALLKEVRRSSNTLIFRALQEEKQQPVIIKASTSAMLSEQQKNRFYNEFAIAQRFSSPYIIRYLSIETYLPNGVAIILEDDGSNCLMDALPMSGFSVEKFLALAISLVKGLQEVHRQGVIHQDIKPHNVLLHPETNAVKLIDFSSASQLQQENPKVIKAQTSEITLAYLSPEQTGRINRKVDYRTDFYSLGISFYQLLCGELPFNRSTALEFIHAHIACEPEPLHQKCSHIPKALSQLIMKLLNKDAEDRYQSCQGLLIDLEKCQLAWKQNNSIDEFPLGQEDIAEGFSTTQKFYGREAEVAKLLAAFERTRQQKAAEVLMVVGEAGIGKSSLINEVHKPLTLAQGYFITGKYDQLNKNIAYSAISAAIQQLIKQLLGETDEAIERWRKKIITSLSNDGQVLVDLIPELEWLIGKQTPVAALEPEMAKNRLQRVFHKFISLFAQPAHPLVVFLDDLQWADVASLQLIASLTTGQHSYALLFIGAYRDNEIGLSHPVLTLLNDIKQARLSLQTLYLTPLNKSAVNQWLGDILQAKAQQTETLSDLIQRKTAGNPFFIKMFLQSLYEAKLITFSEQRQWQWNNEKIAQYPATDNVIALMRQRIAYLPLETQTALQWASCLGNSFDLLDLSQVMSTSTEALRENLFAALHKGIIHHHEDRYHFIHDRVQESAYQLVPDSSKPSMHLKIGQLLLKTKTPLTQEVLFTVVGHINEGQEIVSDVQLRIEYAQLNLRAGQKAKASAAYACAWSYLNAGRRYVSFISHKMLWQQHPALAFDLHKELAEVEYLNGRFEQSEETIKLALTCSNSTVAQAEFYNLLILQKNMQGYYQQAIDAGRAALAILAIEFPLPANVSEKLAEEEIELNKHLAPYQKQIQTLLHHSETQDNEIKAAFKILMNLYIAGYLYAPDLFPIIILKLVNLSIASGHAPESALGYAAYGMWLCRQPTMPLNYQLGYEFGLLAIKLSEKYQDTVQKCRCYNLIVNCIFAWTQPLHQVNPLIQAGIDAGLTSGELQYTGYLYQYKARSLFDQGVLLPALAKELVGLLEFPQQTKNQVAIDLIAMMQLIVANLLGHTANLKRFQLNDLTEEAYCLSLKQHQSHSALALYLMLKGQVFYLYGYYEEALESLKASEELFEYIPGQLALANHNWYYSLTLLQLFPKATRELQQEYWLQIDKNQQQMQCWANSCKENFQHKFLLVAAQMACLQSKSLEDIAPMYDQAIELAKAHGFIQEHALACELAANYWHSKNLSVGTKGYIMQAFQIYQRWGAVRKLELLKQQYAYINMHTVLTDYLVSPETTISSQHLQSLDMTSILQASQALSSETNIGALLDKIMRILIENIGAQRGSLLWVEDGQLLLQAEYFLHNQVEVMQTLPFIKWSSGSHHVVNYVLKSQKPLILDHAAQEESFTHDAYLANQQIKSVLCFPLIKQKIIRGVLYFENNLFTHAFKNEHLQVLTILANQIAISLENAYFFEQKLNAAQQLAESERQRAKEAEYARQKQQDFINTICHEIRNPLQGIKGSIMFLQEDLQSANTLIKTQVSSLNPILNADLSQYFNRFKEYVEAIEQCANHQKVITDDVLRLSCLDKQKIEKVDVTFYPNDVVYSIIKMLQAKVREKNLQIKLELLSENLPVIGDPNLLSEVLLNLLLNAIRFTSVGAITIRTQIVGESNKNSLSFIVSDTGMGMTFDEQKKIFDGFAQATRVVDKDYGGSGLGLSIAKNLIELMGGSIKVNSQKWQGTTFTFTVPVRINNQKQALIAVKKTEGNISSSSTNTRTKVADVNNILIVEDNQINQRITKRLLEQAGYQCKVANNGQEALQKIANERFDFIFMDIEMPIMDGFETTKQIRLQERDQRQSSLPIVGLSGYTSEDYIKKGLMAGMNSYLTKPLDVAQLFEKIRNHANHQRSVQALATEQSKNQASAATSRIEEQNSTKRLRLI